MKEIKGLRRSGFNVTGKNLKLSSLAHIIAPYHKIIDQERELMKGNNAIGTTGRGIGPAYEDKVSRQGIRVIDLEDKKLLNEKINNIVKRKK